MSFVLRVAGYLAVALPEAYVTDGRPNIPIIPVRTLHNLPWFCRVGRQRFEKKIVTVPDKVVHSLLSGRSLIPGPSSCVYIRKIWQIMKR